MSGITGIFLRDNGSVDPKLIKNMNKSITHRGLDGSDVWVEGSVALGHQMLHTTPESLNEKLPFKDQTENMVITADARIDNREELMESLGIDIPLGVITDSELILKAYQKWGEECPEKLLGDFAFAIWDADHNKLYCARDHIGVKPFYYYISDEMFLFSSEIKALFSIPKIPYLINEEQVSNFLALIDDKKITSYKNIFRLPAASYMTITFQDNGLKQYWKLDPDYEIHLDSDEEYAKAFLNIFTEAVRCRLRSSFSVGSMLSGGLDSSSIACVAQKILNKHGKYPLKTYSATFETVLESDERYFIEKVLQFYNFDSHFIEADKISPLADIDNFLSSSDEIMIYPNTFVLWNIYREASKNGVRIVLDGIDGDTTVSYGAGFLTELLLTLRWKKLFFEIQGRSKRLEISPFKKTLNVILDSFTPKNIKRMKWFLELYFGRNSSRSRIIKSDSAQRKRIITHIVDSQYIRIVKTNSRRLHYIELISATLQNSMEYSDWISSQFSIEARHPFFDKRMIEFCLAIPTEQKLWNGWDRVIIRRAMNNILPAEVQWRERKGDLAPNFNINFIKFGKELLDDIILRNSYLIEDYVDIEILQNIYNQYKSGDPKDNMHLWIATILALWLRKKGFKS